MNGSLFASAISGDMLNVINIVLICLFVAVLLSMVIFFLVGLTRGWRYGTFRLIFFGLLFILCFTTLKPISAALGNSINMSGWGLGSPSFDLPGTDPAQRLTIVFTTPFETIKNAISDALKAYQVNMNPDDLQNYASAMSSSILALLLLLVESIILAILGNILCAILWHAAFIHTIPKDKRATAKKQGKLLSAFEELVIGVVIGAMFLFPLTSIANSASYGWNKVSKEEDTKLRANNDTYATIQDVVDTYTNSVFAKAFFSWSAGDTGTTIDMRLTDLLTKSSAGNATFSFVNEISSLTKIGSYAIEGGLLSSNGGFNATKVAMFMTSEYAPLTLSALAQSDLFTGLMPYALTIATNMKEVKGYVQTDPAIDFSSYNYRTSLNTLASKYKSLLASDLMVNLVDDDGNLSSTSDIVKSAFSSNSKTPLEDLLNSFDSEDLKVFDALIEAAVYCQGAKDYKTINASEDSKKEYASKLTFVDFVPQFIPAWDDGSDTPKWDESAKAAIQNINWGHEIALVYDSLANMFQKDVNKDNSNSLLNILASGFTTSAFSLDSTLLTSSIIDNLDEVAYTLFGVKSQSSAQGAESTSASTSASSTTETSLLDSTFILSVLPKTLNVLASTLNSSFSLEGTSAIDMTATNNKLFVSDYAVRKTNAHTEMGNLYTVIHSIAGTEKGKALLKDLKGLPGIYFTPKGDYVGMDHELLGSLADGLPHLDQSEIAKAMMPKVFSHFLSGENSVVKQLLNIDLQMSFENATIGTEMANFILAYDKCQDLVNFGMNITKNAVSGSAAGELVQGLLKYTCTYVNSKGTSVIETQLAYLLKTFVGSSILNPSKVVNGKTVYNSNIANIITTFLKSSLDVTAERKAVYTSKVSDAVSTLDVAHMKNEVESLVGVLNALSTSKLASKLGDFTSTQSLSSFKGVDFTTVFASIDNSLIINSFFGDYLDDTILTTDYAKAETGVTAPSFTNIVSWQAEGAAFQSIVKAAIEIGDLGNIDFMNSDPTAVESILSALSGSQIFVKRNLDTQGNVASYDYLFPEYMASKFAKYLGDASADVQVYFSDFANTAAPYTFNTFKSDFATAGGSKLTSLSETELQTQQTNWATEAGKIGSVISYSLRVNGFNSVGSGQDLSKLNANDVKGLFSNVAQSSAFGHVVTYHIFKTLNDNLVNGDTNSPFVLSNLAYLEDCDMTARRSEAFKAAEIFRVVTDPIYGLLNAQGELDTTKLSLKNSNADYLVSPILKSLASSAVFNTVKTGESYTAFEKELSKSLKDSAVYGDTVLDTTLDDIVASIRGNSTNLTLYSLKWDDEIDVLCSALTDIKDLDLNMDSFDFKALFPSGAANATLRETNRVKVETLLNDINKSQILYRALPIQLVKATSQYSSSSFDLSAGNYYYEGKDASGLSAHPYGTADGTFASTNGSQVDEITVLSYIVEDSALLGTSFSTTDLQALDVDTASNMLAKLVQSHIFNSTASGAGLTVAQTALSKAFLAGDAISTVYFNAANPKDVANTSLYTDAKTKSEYTAQTAYPAQANTVNLLESVTTTDIDGESTNEVVSGTTLFKKASLKGLLTAIKADTSLTDALKNNDTSHLSESQLQVLLSGMNSCVYYQDCVPNTLAKFTGSGSSISISGIDIARANPYYCYYVDAAGDVTYTYDSDPSSATYGKVLYSNPVFTNTYSANEILTLSSLITKANNGTYTSLFSNLSGRKLTTSDVANLREMLDLFASSYVFHLGGPWDGSQLTISAKTSVPDDLTVLEQCMFSIYDMTGLSSRAFDQAYDYQIYAKHTADGAKYKTYQAIKAFNSSLGGTLHAGEWSDEIDALTVKYASDGVTPDGGLFYTVITDPYTSAKFSSGTDFSSNSSGLGNLADISPDTLGVIIKAMNQLDIVHDSVPYAVAGLVENSLGFAKYSTLTGEVNVNATSYNTENLGLIGHHNLLTVHMASEVEPSVYAYDEAGASSTQKFAVTNPTHTSGSLDYVFDLSTDYPLYFEVTSSATIASLTFNYNTSNYLLKQSELLQDDNGITALDVIVNFAKAIYMPQGTTPETYAYVHFSDDTQVKNFFINSASNFAKILAYLSANNGFYTRRFFSTTLATNATNVYTLSTSSSYRFAPRDIALRGILAIKDMTYAGTSFNADLGKYLGKSGTDLAAYCGAKEMFTATGYSDNTEGAFLANNLTKLVQVEGLYSTVSSLSVGSFTLPKVHAWVEAFIDSSESIYQNLLAVVDNAIASSESGLGKRFAAGFLDRLGNEEYSYIKGGSYFTSLNLLNAPTSVDRSTYFATAFEVPSFYDTDFALLTTSVRASLSAFFTIASNMSISKQYTTGLTTVGKAFKDPMNAAFQNFQNAQTSGGELADLLKVYYVGTIYDYFVNRAFYNATPGVDYPNPSASGFLYYHIDPALTNTAAASIVYSA